MDCWAGTLSLLEASTEADIALWLLLTKDIRSGRGRDINPRTYICVSVCPNLQLKDKAAFYSPNSRLYNKKLNHKIDV